MIDHKELMKQGADLIAANLAECCREELEWQNTALLCNGKMREAGEIYAQVDASHALSIVQSEVARQAMQVVAAAPQVAADERAALNEIADLFSIGAEVRKDPGTILANVRNTVKFANLLHAVEREFFMNPDDENECLVNCWGSTEEQYLTAMRAALQSAPVQAQEPVGEEFHDALHAALVSALKNHRMVSMFDVEEDGPGAAHHLVDRLSLDALDIGGDISTGEEEIVAIVDAVFSGAKEFAMSIISKRVHDRACTCQKCLSELPAPVQPVAVPDGAGATFARQLIDSGAENYIGEVFDTERGDIEVVARYVHGKTPADKLAELEARTPVAQGDKMMCVKCHSSKVTGRADCPECGQKTFSQRAAISAKAAS